MTQSDALILITIAGFIGLWLALGKITDVLLEISKTLRRIEARLTLHRPLEAEEGALKGPVGSDVEQRAIQPDVWARLRNNEAGDVLWDKSLSQEDRHNKYRALLKFHRYKEKLWRR